MISADVMPARFAGPFLCVLASTFLVALPRAQPQPDLTVKRADSTAAAQMAAERWLARVDTSAWDAAWEEASVLLRDSISQEVWQAQGRWVRDTVGTLRSRRLTRAQLRDQIEGGSAEGPFVMLRFRSEFEDGLYVETALVAWSDEGWRVAGYEVAPLETSPSRRRPTNRNGATP